MGKYIFRYFTACFPSGPVLLTDHANQSASSGQSLVHALGRKQPEWVWPFSNDLVTISNHFIIKINSPEETSCGQVWKTFFSLFYAVVYDYFFVSEIVHKKICFDIFKNVIFKMYGTAPRDLEYWWIQCSKLEPCIPAICGRKRRLCEKGAKNPKNLLTQVLLGLGFYDGFIFC